MADDAGGRTGWLVGMACVLGQGLHGWLGIEGVRV